MTTKIYIDVAAKPTKLSSSDGVTFSYSSKTTPKIVRNDGLIDLTSINDDVDLIFQLDDATLTWSDLPDIGSFNKTFRMNANSSGFDTCWASGDFSAKRTYNANDYPNANAILTGFVLDASGKTLTVGVRYQAGKQRAFVYYYELHIAVPLAKRNRAFFNDPKIKNGGDTFTTFGNLLERMRIILVDAIQSLRAVFRGRAGVLRDGVSSD